MHFNKKTVSERRFDLVKNLLLKKFKNKEKYVENKIAYIETVSYRHLTLPTTPYV